MGRRTVASTSTLLIAGLLSSGCASIISGSSDPITILTSNDEPATCLITGESGREFPVNNAPTTLVIDRGDGPLQVVCEGEGTRGTATVSATLDGNFWWNLLSLALFVPAGVVGLVWDFSSGNHMAYQTSIVLPMQPASGAGPGPGVLPGRREEQADDMDADTVIAPVGTDPVASGTTAPPVDTLSAADDPFATGASDPFATIETDPFAPTGTDPFALAGTDPAAAQSAVAPPPDPAIAVPEQPLPVAAAPDDSSTVWSGTAPVQPPADDPVAAMPVSGADTMAMPVQTAADPRFPPSRSGGTGPRVQGTGPAVGRFAIQTGAFAVAANAEQAAQRLSDLGLDPRIKEQGRLNLVRFGAFNTRGQARRALRTFKNRGGGDAVVVIN